jgi:hypothetical protein
MCEALESTREDLAFTAFERLFAERGLPVSIRSDNGVPFASPNALFNLSKLSVWWLRLGIAIERIKPGHPQQNDRMKSALARLGVRGFKPHLRKAPERLAGLRTAEGTGLPANIIEEFRRDCALVGAALSIGMSQDVFAACTHWKAPPFHGARQNLTHAPQQTPLFFDHLVGETEQR